MKAQRITILFVCASLLSVCGTTQAGILQDFRFKEVNGTVITGAANSASAGNNWLSQNTSIEAKVHNGNFRIQKGSESSPVTGQVGNTLDIANVTSGKVWLMANIKGWNYTATGSSPPERVRFGFLDNTDPVAPGSSTITAEMTIDRLPDNSLVLSGEALGTGVGATNVAADLPLSLTRSTPLRIALELDKDADQYSVYYKDGTDPFALLGTGELGPSSLHAGDRNGNSVRFAFTGTFLASAGEFFDVDRIWLTDVNPIPEPCSLAIASLAAMFLLLRRRQVG